MQDCYFCLPRVENNEHRKWIAKLSISTLCLFGDQRFRGYSLLLFDARHATGLEELTADEYAAYLSDLRQASTAIRTALQPDHMNYACLGNTTPHLHWHIIPRVRDDVRWGQPVWEGWPRNEFTDNRHALSDAEYASLVKRIQAALRF